MPALPCHFLLVLALAERLATSAAEPSVKGVPDHSLRGALVEEPSAASSPSWWKCGDFNSDDCQAEWQKAHQNGSFYDFCQRCDTETGADPLRNRCQLCCAQCAGLDVCSDSVPGPCRDCVVKMDGFCESGFDNLCLDACCGPTTFAPVGCLDECRPTPQCYHSSVECADFNSDDCEAEWQNAYQSGSFYGFCQRCDTETGADPLRHRCQLCCAQCAGLDVCSDSVPGPCRDCVVKMDGFCAYGFDNVCLDACCGPTDFAPLGCFEECRPTPQCYYSSAQAGEPRRLVPPVASADERDEAESGGRSDEQISPSTPSWLKCADFNSDDCEDEWQNAYQSGSFYGFCQRCGTETGAHPLRNRCQLCCAQCAGLDVCSDSVPGPCRDCVVKMDGFCAYGFDNVCLDACCGPTDFAPLGCFEECRPTPQCYSSAL